MGLGGGDARVGSPTEPELPPARCSESTPGLIREAPGRLLPARGQQGHQGRPFPAVSHPSKSLLTAFVGLLGAVGVTTRMAPTAPAALSPPPATSGRWAGGRRGGRGSPPWTARCSLRGDSAPQSPRRSGCCVWASERLGALLLPGRLSHSDAPRGRAGLLPLLHSSRLT